MRPTTPDSRPVIRPLWLVLLGLALAILLCIPLPTAAAPARQSQPAGLSLAATAGYDGYYRTENWVPVRIRAANDGPAIAGQLQVAVGSGRSRVVYRQPITLPSQSSKEATLYVLLSGFTRSLDVELIDERGRLIASAVTNNLNRLEAGDLLYLVVGGEPGRLDFLARVPGSYNSSSVAYVTPGDLPDRAAAWNGLDIVIFSDVDSGQLTAVQRQLLSDWVTLGGQLVVAGGPGWAKTTAAFGDLLPVSATDLRSVADLPALSEWAGAPFRDPGPYLVTVSSLRNGRLLLHQDGLPLLAARSTGRGQVLFLALDPRLAPLADWDGGARVWTEILNQLPRLPYWARGVNNAYPAGRAVATLPTLALPSVVQLLLFLAAYVAVIGPVNYLVLKRLERRELAWLTIPGLVLLFSVVPYLIGFQLKGNQVIANQMSIAYGPLGAERLRVQSVIGLYSPRRASYDLAIPGDALARPFNRDDFSSPGGGGDVDAVIQAGDTVMERVRVDVGGVASFLADGYREMPRLTGESTLRLADGRFHLDVAIVNNSEQHLTNANLLVGSHLIRLGDLAAGGRVTRSRELTAIDLGGGGATLTFPGPPTGGYGSRLLDQYSSQIAAHNNPSTAFARAQLLSAMEAAWLPDQQPWTPRDVVTLIAWSEEPQLALGVDGRSVVQQATTLYLLELPVALQARGGQAMSVPPALLEMIYLETGGGFYRGGPAENTLPPGSWAEVEFQPWPYFRALEVAELSLMVQTATPAAAEQPVVQLYDWRESVWVTVDIARWDGASVVPDGRRFVGDDNVVRARLRNDGSRFLEVRQFWPVLTGAMP